MPAEPDSERRPAPEDLPGEVERERADLSAVSIMAAIAICVAVGMWFYAQDRDMIAGDGTTVKHTTGTDLKEAPLPSRPAPAEPPQSFE